MAVLYDANNRKIEFGSLDKELAGPTLTGIRRLWTETVASGLTPGKLVQILRSAADGDASEYLTLAEEMEERDPHYASVLGTRKRALSGLDVTVESASDDGQDVERADAVRALTKRPDFDFLIEDLLDSLGKGYSVVEILWDRSSTRWEPHYEWRDPHWFRFDRTSGREVRLLTEEAQAEGVPLAPYKFLVHKHRLKSGIPIRCGLAFLVAWAYMFKAYTIKDWIAFIETFGMPVRLGRYGQNASKDDIAVLVRAVANIGTDAGAVLPESMQIEFPESSNKASSVGVYDAMVQWLDRQVSKAVLGQTMTSDDGSSLAQAKIHNDVRLDILRADAKQVAATLNRDLVRPYIDLNFGPPPSGIYPELCLPVPEPEDINLLVNALEKLVPLGLKVEASVIRDKLGIPDPEEGAELLTAPAAPPSVPNKEENPPAKEPEEKAANRAKAAPKTTNEEEPQDESDLPDLQAEALAKTAGPGMDAMIDQLRAMVDAAESLEGLRDSLAKAYPALDSKQFADAMAEAMTSAHFGGRWELLEGV